LDRAGKPFFGHEPGYSVVGASREARDRAPEPPASLCGNTIGPALGILFPPMLFPCNALTSGPQACFFAEKKNTKVKGAREKSGLMKKGEYVLIGGKTCST